MMHVVCAVILLLLAAPVALALGLSLASHLLVWLCADDALADDGLIFTGYTIQDRNGNYRHANTLDDVGASDTVFETLIRKVKDRE